MFSAYECFASMCIRTPSLCSTLGGQQRALDPLELKLQANGSHHVGAGNQKPRSSQDQAVLLITEPSISPAPFLAI